ncbi:MAG: phosphoglycolate phosphatase [Magnetospirillum sp.]|nr:phosphoglycolate phosphatase [Magnetospirillum sp.]
MRQAKRAVLFDLDGTLIHSLPDLTSAVNHILAEEGRDAVTEAEVGPMVGDGAHTLMERAFAARGGMPAVGAAAVLSRFLAFYEANATTLTRPFPHVAETLARLKDKGLVLAVCTNKPTAATHEILQALELDHYFAVVVGGDDTPALKPSPVHVDTVLDRLGVARDEAVMVGDSVNDVLAAKGAQVPCIVVTFGYSRTPVSEPGRRSGGGRLPPHRRRGGRTGLIKLRYLPIRLSPTPIISSFCRHGRA